MIDFPQLFLISSITKREYHMHSIYHFFSFRRIFSLSIFLTIFTILQSPTLEAGGWGKTKEVVEYEGTTWNTVYFDMNGLYFEASVPNYSGALLQNDTASL